MPILSTGNQRTKQTLDTDKSEVQLANRQFLHFPAHSPSPFIHPTSVPIPRNSDKLLSSAWHYSEISTFVRPSTLEPRLYTACPLCSGTRIPSDIPFIFA